MHVRRQLLGAGANTGAGFEGLQLRSTPFWYYVYRVGVLPCALRTLGCGIDLRRLLLTINQAPRIGSSIQDKLFVIFV